MAVANMPIHLTLQTQPTDKPVSTSHNHQVAWKELQAAVRELM